jgi:hypothetical protein
MNKEKRLFLARQTARAVQLFAGNLPLTETEAMEIADLYEPWTPGKKYPAGKTLKFGVNQDGETQLYSVMTEHTSQADWTPEAAPSLFKAIGFTEEGVSIWTQPLGAGDAYHTGDAVSHSGKRWTSDRDGNVWEPGVYGWTEAE